MLSARASYQKKLKSGSSARAIFFTTPSMNMPTAPLLLLHPANAPILGAVLGPLVVEELRPKDAQCCPGPGPQGWPSFSNLKKSPRPKAASLKGKLQNQSFNLKSPVELCHVLCPMRTSAWLRSRPSSLSTIFLLSGYLAE
ncbi:hypothetical protein CFIO01_01251 [Colletotrichum fioriniae PJ7]|uniref:Uncharacterized protein n=1 Tax=Colletotrichum fioriniae PJ7 TaxID=1445577 RepID=A0A010RQZ1_9PEZI|nr:hypothetical protein CFIO01_01251 [Colletotrichum fioriniae PJ7]